MSKGEWNPGRKYQTILAQIKRVLSNGEKRTVRDVYYALEANGNKWDYRFIKRAVKKGRRTGRIDPNQIIDSSRQPVNTVSDGFTNPEQFLNARVREIWNQYTENHWKYQDTYVEVWLEKQSLATVFRPICQRKGVRLEATRGDWSDSKVFEATERIRGKLQDGKDIHILYFGDFNPSGFHAPVSILDTMGFYGLDLGREFPDSSEPEYYDCEHTLPITLIQSEDREELGTFNFERCGINLDHIERFDLPENPVPSSTDKDTEIKRYFQKYVSTGRDTNVELNALKEFEREFLEDLIAEKIEEHVDEGIELCVEERINQARDALSTAVQIDDSDLSDVFNPPIGPEDIDS